MRNMTDETTRHPPRDPVAAEDSQMCLSVSMPVFGQVSAASSTRWWSLGGGIFRGHITDCGGFRRVIQSFFFIVP